MAKTMFAADAALESLLASSSPKPDQTAKPKAQVPAKAPRPKPAAKATCRPKPLPASPQSDPPERQQLNVEVDCDLLAAVNLRKTRSRLAGSKAEDSYCKIVEIALRKHLASEINLVSMMKSE